MSFEGMDPDEVESLAAQLDAQVRRLTSVAAVVDGVVHGLVTEAWLGPVAGLFSAEWTTLHKPHLTALNEQTAQWVGELRGQATDQRRTSAQGTEGLMTPGALTRGAFHGKLDPTNRNYTADMAFLSGKAYDYQSPYTRYTAPDGTVFTVVKQYDHGDGFSATLFEFRRPDGTMGHVLAYAGTNPKDLSGDVATDIDDGLGLPTSQYREGTDLASSLSKQYPDLVFTGHSLGGGLATAGSVATGHQAVTFNGSVPRGADMSYAQHVGQGAHADVTNFSTKGDPVSAGENTLGTGSVRHEVYLQDNSPVDPGENVRDVVVRTAGPLLPPQISVVSTGVDGVDAVRDHLLGHVVNDISTDRSGYFTS